MSEIPALGSQAVGDWLGILKALLQARAGDIAQPPADMAGVAERSHAQGQAQGHGTPRVLLVDDNPLNLMVISARLASRGLALTLAADGVEAVARACEVPFDLILMDLQMPTLGGLAATTMIRRFESLSSRPPVPVIAHSSSSVGDDVLAAHGFNGSLSKPCSNQELDDCLARWCPGCFASHPAQPANEPGHARGHCQEPSRAGGTGRASMR